jgi:magnesium transporter
LEDVITENQQAIEMTNIASNLLSQMMDAFASIISNNQNQVIKLLTSVTIVLNLPTLISSFFGMNVSLPLSNSPHAFAWISLVSVAVMSSAVFIFKRRDWF